MAPSQAEEIAREIHKAMESALDSYRCEHTRELADPDNGLPLIDLLTPECDSDVARGREEMDSLAEHIWSEINSVAIIERHLLVPDEARVKPEVLTNTAAIQREVEAAIDAMRVTQRLFTLSDNHILMAACKRLEAIAAWLSWPMPDKARVNEIREALARAYSNWELSNNGLSILADNLSEDITEPSNARIPIIKGWKGYENLVLAANAPKWLACLLRCSATAIRARIGQSKDKHLQGKPETDTSRSQIVILKDSSLKGRPVFTIKPLEWEHSNDALSEDYIARTSRYQFSVWKALHISHWQVTTVLVGCQPCASPEEGKALAEKHWQEYIKQGLEKEN